VSQILLQKSLNPHPAIAQRHLALQKLPIGNPDPIPKRQFIQKKTHGRADARGLTGPELADRALIVKEQGEQQQRQPAKRGKAKAATPEQEDRSILIPATYTPEAGR